MYVNTVAVTGVSLHGKPARAGKLVHLQPLQWYETIDLHEQNGLQN